MVLCVTLAACGSGDDGGGEERRDTRRGPTLADWRLDVRERCREYSEQRLERARRLPSTRAQARRFERRVLGRERRFLVRLGRIPAPASERIGFRQAVRDRRRAIDQVLRGQRKLADRTSRRAAAALERMNLVDCALPGAYGAQHGLSYVLDRDRNCRTVVRRLRRSARTVRSLPPGETKLQAGLAFAKRLREFGRRHPIESVVPSPGKHLERQAFRSVRAMAEALMDALHAARRFDDAAFNRARRRLSRNAFRGAAAWQVLNVPGCEALYKLRLV